jgi:antitoxin component YwqK of YwqJK toxin-antitoxin module
MKKYIVVVYMLLACTSALAQSAVEHWKNGKIKSEGEKKDGKEEGYWVYYHPSGVVSAQGNYAQGEKIGEWKTW